MKERPTIIELDRADGAYEPGETLRFRCRIPDTQGVVKALEVSVLWYTEGKGDEDHGVIHQERLRGEDEWFTESQQFKQRLPNSPLSYHGVIFKIRWFWLRCARLKTIRLPY